MRQKSAIAKNYASFDICTCGDVIRRCNTSFLSCHLTLFLKKHVLYLKRCIFILIEITRMTYLHRLFFCFFLVTIKRSEHNSLALSIWDTFYQRLIICLLFLSSKKSCVFLFFSMIYFFRLDYWTKLWRRKKNSFLLTLFCCLKRTKPEYYRVCWCLPSYCCCRH